MKLKEALKEDKELKIIIVVLLILGTIIGLAISYTTAVEIRKTESGQFCSKCHTMEPMTQTHYASPHGGNNKFGVAAQCVDCHLPHDTLRNYINTKAKFGLHDIYTEFFTNTADINWTKKREHPEKFVFNSGCLSCHTNLDHSTMGKLEPEIVKRADNKTLKTSCLECHPNVGHKRK